MMPKNMTYKSMTVAINNNVAHITLNRPDEFNTMNLDFWQELPKVINEISDESAARVREHRQADLRTAGLPD